MHVYAKYNYKMFQEYIWNIWIAGTDEVSFVDMHIF